MIMCECPSAAVLCSIFFSFSFSSFSKSWYYLNNVEIFHEQSIAKRRI